MPDESVSDVTQGEKRQEAARNHNTLHCPCLSRQEKVGDYWTQVGWRTSETERLWTDEPHALVTDFILASLVSAELLMSS